LSSLVTLDLNAARHLAVSHGISTAEAKKIGALLFEAVNRGKAKWPIDAERPAAA
jgi:hypothetical protein